LSMKSDFSLGAWLEAVSIRNVCPNCARDRLNQTTLVRGKANFGSIVYSFESREAGGAEFRLLFKVSGGGFVVFFQTRGIAFRPGIAGITDSSLGSCACATIDFDKQSVKARDSPHSCRMTKEAIHDSDQETCYCEIQRYGRRNRSCRKFNTQH